MAGRIPQDFINDLLERVDIVELIDARLKLKKAGKNYQALCPFHTEKTPSFSVSPEKQFYHCFGCGESGTALTFLLEYDRLDFVDAVETLAQLVGVEVPREHVTRPRERGSASLYDLLRDAARFYERALKASEPAVDYLKQRGLSGVVAKSFALGYAPDAWDSLLTAFRGRAAELIEAGLVIRNDQDRTYDRFRRRILFPIRDSRGRVIGFGGRVLPGDDGPKYLNSPETPVFQKGKELYGLYEARRSLRTLERLVMVEGYMDVVALAQHGVTCAVAALGTATSEDHFRKMFRHTSQVICCFDGDAAGRQAAWRALRSALPALEDGRTVKFMFLPEGEDPDTIIRSQGRAAFEQRMDGAVSATEYFFNQLAMGLDLKTLEGRARLEKLARPEIERLPAGVLNALMSQRLQQLTGLVSEGGARQSQSAGAPRPHRTRASASRGRQRLSQRLAALLLQGPDLLKKLTDETRQLLHTKVAAPGVEGLLAEIVQYKEENPNAGIGQLLGAWTGEPTHAELVSLIEQPLELDAQAMAAEFQDGIVRLAQIIDREDRRKALEQVRQVPTKDEYLRYLSLNQKGRDES